MKTTIITLALAIALPTAAQNTAAQKITAQRKLSLDECLSMAVENSVSVRNSANSLQGAREQGKEAFTNYFPTVSATATGFVANDNLIEMSLAEGIGMAMLKDGVTSGVTATMPLFAGGQIANGNRLARVGVDASALQHQKAIDQARLATEQYYWQIAALRGKLSTIDAVEKQLESMARDVDVAVRVGVTDRNDLLQVNLRQNEMRTSRLQVENAIAITLNLLAQHIGMGGETIDIDDETEIENPANYYIDPQAALNASTDHALLATGVEAARLQKRIEVGKHLPTVAVGGAYTYNNLLDKDKTSLIGFATVSIPISGWWGGSHAIKRKTLELQNARNNMDDASEKIVIDIRNKWNTLDVAYRQVEIARESIGQSAENLRLFNDYYRAGTSTMSDLLDAQTLFAQSNDKLAEARANYRIALAEYLVATGR